MLQVINKWLEYIFHSPMDIDMISLKIKMCDGTLVAQILNYYEIIDKKELTSIEETLEPTYAYCNYLKVKKWLKRINIDLLKSDIIDITQCESTTGFTLLVEIYMQLETDERMEKFMEYSSKPTRFMKTAVKQDISKDYVLTPDPKCEPLLEKWDLTNWTKDRLTSLLEQFRQSRIEYKRYLDEKEATAPKIIIPVDQDSVDVDIAEIAPDEDIEECSYGELLHQQYRAQNFRQFVPDPKKAKTIVRNLKSKHRKEREMNAQQLEMQKELVHECWEEVQTNQDQDFNKLVAEKLMTKSIVEKKIAKELFRIRYEKDQVIERARLNYIEWQRRQDEEFIRRLFEEYLEDRIKFHDERMEIIRLHRQKYEEKMRLKALKHEKLCQDIMTDMVDIAIKAAEYKKIFGEEPSKHIQKNWATLFVKQQSIPDLVAQVGDLKKCLQELPDFIEDIHKKESLKQNILDEQDFDDYHNLQNIWACELEPEEQYLITCGMNILGYIVHRLLLIKYPEKRLLRPDLSPDITTTVCITIDGSEEKINILQRLLAFKDILVVTVKDVIDFCLLAYKTEATVEYNQQLPEDFEEKVVIYPTPKDDKGKIKGKTKEKKKGGKEKKEKKGKKDKKEDKKKKKDKDIAVTTDEGPQTVDKVVQTPRAFPGEQIILSKKAEFGKLVVEQLEHEPNKEVEDQLFVDMLVQYLIDKPSIKGWVLVNFPKTYEQAAILEEVLSADHPPKDYFLQVLKKLSLESVQVTISTSTSSIELSIVSQENVIENYLQNIELEDEIEEKQEDTHLENQHQRFLIAEGESVGEEFALLESESSSTSLITLDSITCQEKVKHILPEILSVFDDIPPQDILSEQQQTDSVVCTCKKVAHLDTQSICECALNEHEKLEQKYEGCVPKLELPEEIEEVKQIVTESTSQDTLYDLRNSRLVPNLIKQLKKPYKTILTAYIRMLPHPEPDPYDDEPIPIFKELEEPDGIAKFYIDQGCFYVLKYEDLDNDTLKCLAKTIIGDYSLPLKSSVEILGERYMEAFYEVGDVTITKKGAKKPPHGPKKKIKEVNKDEDKKSKKAKKGKDKGKKDKKGSKKESKKGSKRGSKKGKKDKQTEPAVEPITFSDKSSQFPEPEEIIWVEPPKPGEDGWNYINLLLPDSIGLSLAILWENMEHVYIDNLKQMFFLKRVLLNAIMPYIAYVKTTMGAFIVRPDERQEYLFKIQKILNEIDIDLRSDEKTKNQLIMQIDIFKEKMKGICDSKMEESEVERRRLINSNWIYRQLCEIVNNSEIAFQIELDRFVDTVQLITDYYTCIIYQQLNRKDEDILPKIILEKSLCPEKIMNEISEMQTEVGYKDLETGYHSYTKQVCEQCHEFVTVTIEGCLAKMKAASRLFDPKKKKQKGKWEPMFEVQDNSTALLDEWKAILAGEQQRIKMRLDLIKTEILDRIEEILRWSQEVFFDIYRTIKERYQEDLNAVDRACQIIVRAVKDEKLIYPQLILDNNILLRMKILLFNTNVPSPDDAFESANLSLDQIEYMTRVLLDIAPSGHLRENVFKLLIQDMLYVDNDTMDAMKNKIPPLWRNRTINELHHLFEKLFDLNDFVHWRDFIILNIGVPFPTRLQLMETRNAFREFDYYEEETVSHVQFERIIFWFEDGIEKSKADQIKKILQMMYTYEHNNIYYTYLLLDFCKDEDPLVGFVKALELSLGKYICFNEETGRQYVDRILSQRTAEELQQLMREEERNIVGGELRDALYALIDRIVREHESLIIEDVPQEEKEEEEEEEEEEGYHRNTHKQMSSLITQVSCFSIKKLLTEQKFSNIEIGYECNNELGLVHLLPRDLIFKVIYAALPWHAECFGPHYETFVDQVSAVYNECKNIFFNKKVLSHEFLNHPKIQKLFRSLAKFSSNSPVQILKEIVERDDQVVEDEEAENKAKYIDSKLCQLSWG